MWTKRGWIRGALAVGAFVGTIGCAGEPDDAARGMLAGDVTSCYRSQLVQPASCTAPIGVFCSRPLEECAAVGCRIDGSGMVLYPDFSWAEAGRTGTYALSRLDGWAVVTFQDGTTMTVDDTGAAVPGCD